MANLQKLANTCNVQIPRSVAARKLERQQKFDKAGGGGEGKHE